MIVVHTSIAFVNILVSLNGIFSGNFSLVIATSKKKGKANFLQSPCTGTNKPTNQKYKCNIPQSNHQNRYGRSFHLSGSASNLMDAWDIQNSFKLIKIVYRMKVIQ